MPYRGPEALRISEHPLVLAGGIGRGSSEGPEAPSVGPRRRAVMLVFSHVLDPF